MKFKFKSAVVKTSVMILLLALSQSVFAGIEEHAPGNSSLNPAQVIFYFMLMIALIIAPLFKQPRKTDK